MTNVKLKEDGITQTEDKLDILFAKYSERYSNELKQISDRKGLVDYEQITDSSDNDNVDDSGTVVLTKDLVLQKIDNFVDKLLSANITFNKNLNQVESNIIEEISQRKNLKRAGDAIENKPPKICKTSRRKSKPVKIQGGDKKVTSNGLNLIGDSYEDKTFNCGFFTEVPKNELSNLHVCLLCETQCQNAAALATHIFESHNLNVTQFADTDNLADKKKKMPSLLKISDLKQGDNLDKSIEIDITSRSKSVATHQCSLCGAPCQSYRDVYAHLCAAHASQAALACGVCARIWDSPAKLATHAQRCAVSCSEAVTARYNCRICRFADNARRTVEAHVLVHNFLLEMCRREMRVFDPSDYIECDADFRDSKMANVKTYTCNLCGRSHFSSFKEFSAHRRTQHSKYHCDLCNKFYGRNSHLWKHVNRLHKNHPSVTCLICNKTSASKYHLAQHFAKLHNSTAKSGKIRNENDENKINGDKSFNWNSNEGLNGQSVDKDCDSEDEDLSNNGDVSDFEDDKKTDAPKELDVTSDLYTNIITNYTPPPNGGEFKCPKCGKGFSKKVILKKHKKNCRPRLQKDLLTRCKSCSRIFKDRQSLAKHLVNYHSEYQCEICQQKAQSKCEIVAHIRFTHPNCHLFCRMCGNILRSHLDLVEHIADHANSYICQFCADPLPSKIKLKMHILSLHRKILSLSCGICLKLFETQHILRDHVRLVHRDELTPFTSCTICGKNYGSKWKTYDHLNKSHGRIFKACKTCLEVFDTEEQLNFHYESVHMSKTPSATIQAKSNVVISSNVTKTLKPTKYEEESDDSLTMGDSENETGENEQNQCLQEPNYSLEDSANLSKISLLEKRLLGSKQPNESSVKKPTPQRPKTPEQKIKIKEEESAVNLHPGSSKRTVYVNSDVPSVCEICHKTWPAKKHLWQHYIRCHKSVAATVCGICLKTNPTYVELQKHLRETHPTLLHGQGFGSNFICRICGRYHNASSKLGLHMAIHENFDWSILDDGKCERRDDECNEDKKVEWHENVSDNYFESLIEQVELSEGDDDVGTSENDSNNAKNEPNIEIQKEESTSTEIVEDTEAADDSDDSCSDSTKSIQFIENFQNKTEAVYSSPDSESSDSDDGSSEEDIIKKEASLVEDSDTNSSSIIFVEHDVPFSGNAKKAEPNEFSENGVFNYKMEEIDTAVKSISFDCMRDIKDEMGSDYCDLPMSSALNEREIESAVGSIL